jgi:adsorption protein B
MEHVYLNILHFFQTSYAVLYLFAFIVATFLLLSGIDDLAVDLYYWYHQIFRRKKVQRFQDLPVEKLHGAIQKPIAIFVPAWHEQGVIGKMLRRACETLDYTNYEIFVGVYPNDPRTAEEAIRVSRTYPQVHPIMASHNGPSTKAQNLNDIHLGMIEWENVTGLRYEIIVLHDSEDIIHPLSLKCFNAFIPEYDMVQLPVFPLGTPQKSVVHWTYADEFAENHTKDMVVRQLFSGFTPSAGVGTAYNRWLIEFAGSSFALNMFRRQSLTEDYDIALRLALAEANLLYLYLPFHLNIATWAYFPQTFSAAVRQRTRWLIGICIQAWKNYGWVGSARFKITLYRDRKAIVTNIVNALAYVVLTYVLLYELANWGLGQYGRLAPIITRGTFLWYIVLIDTSLMFWRFLHRYLSVAKVYGHLAGLLAIFRLPLGNIINFIATTRALRQYFASRRSRKPILWEKTAHRFPTIQEAPVPK